jgi:hypothetical protein
MSTTGFIVIHRQILESEIFYKPAEWLKIWIYILQKVNFKDAYFQRGENLFNMQSIANDCHCSYNTVDKFLRWARKSKMLATRKTTRGVVVLVLNYAKYQDVDFYKGDTKSETEAKQRRNRGDTIIEQGNNVTKNIYTCDSSEDSSRVISKKEKPLPEGITYEKVFDKYENLSGRKVIAREKWKAKIKIAFKHFTPDQVLKAWGMMSIDDFLRGKNTSGKDYFSIEYALRVQNIEKYYNDFITSQNLQ